MEDVTFTMKTCKTMFYQVKIWLPILEMGWNLDTITMGHPVPVLSLQKITMLELSV